VSELFLSLLIPTVPGRADRLAAVLSRLSLSQSIFPDHSFEVVIIDGGDDGAVLSLCKRMSDFLRIKYIYLPIKRFICAGYPRNVGLRVCEGRVIGMLDIDHWPSEFVTYGMLTPFIHDDDFAFCLPQQPKTTIREYLESGKNKVGLCDNFSVDFVPKGIGIINRGYVLDSSKSSLCQGSNPSAITQAEVHPMALKINQALLNPDHSDWRILDVYKQTQIPPPGVNNTLWTWAVRREHVIALNGYDEKYCQNWAYSREDDDWRERLLALGLKFYDLQNKNFCAIHLHHAASQRNLPQNNWNRKYFQQTCQPVKTIARNHSWDWGKLPQYGYSIIDEKIRDKNDHEEWIRCCVPDMPCYDSQWLDMDHMMKELEVYKNA
jgi:hypothetical protein